MSFRSTRAVPPPERSLRRRVACVSCAALALLLANPSTPAIAQALPAEAEPVTVPVYQMARPFYDAPGVRLGSFLLFPTMSERLGTDDNIFASDSNRASDTVSTTSEALSIGSQWARHRLTAHLFATQDIYARHASNNGYFWGGDVSGRLNITTEALFQLDAGFVQQPLARGTAEAGADAKRPVYNTSNLALAYVQRADRLLNRLQFSVRQNAYVAERDATRSSTRYTASDRISYDVSPGMNVFIQGSYAEHDWRRRSELRDFNLLTGLLGVSFEIPNRIQADFGAGVLRQGFRNSAFHTLVAPTVSERMIWNVLPLTSIIAAMERSIIGTETFCDGSPGACISASGSALPGAPLFGARRNSLDTTAAEIGVQHEFWHDILGEARFRYQRDHFDFNGLTDRTYSLSVNARYLINRYVEANLDYVYRDRTANLPSDRTFNSGPFTENVVSLTLKAGL